MNNNQNVHSYILQVSLSVALVGAADHAACDRELAPPGEWLNIMHLVIPQGSVVVHWNWCHMSYDRRWKRVAPAGTGVVPETQACKEMSTVCRYFRTAHWQWHNRLQNANKQ